MEECPGNRPLATDTKLNRDVAIKILPPALAGDWDRMARFKREARVLASLDHPNIGAIYGLEETEGASALVLALIEGPTLADLQQRIEKFVHVVRSDFKYRLAVAIR